MAMDGIRMRALASFTSAESADRVRERRVQAFWKAREASKRKEAQQGEATTRHRGRNGSTSEAPTLAEKHHALLVRESETRKHAMEQEKAHLHLQSRLTKLQTRVDGLEGKLRRQQARNQGLVAEARDHHAERNRTVKECALRVAEVEAETRKRMEEMEEATRMARVVHFARAASAERRAMEAERRTAHAMQDALESRKALHEAQNRCLEAEEEMVAIQKRTDELLEAARKEGYAQAQQEWQAKLEEQERMVWTAEEEEEERRKYLEEHMVPLERALKASERAADAWKARAHAAEQALVGGKAMSPEDSNGSRRDHAKERLQRLLSKQQKERSQDPNQGAIQVEEREA